MSVPDHVDTLLEDIEGVSHTCPHNQATCFSYYCGEKVVDVRCCPDLYPPS